MRPADASLTPSTLLSRIGPALLLALVCAVPFFWPLVHGLALGPWDQIATMVPGSGAPKPQGPWDVLQADACLQFYVWRDLVFDSWRHGQVPWTNPYSFGGSPLLANSQSGALYPPHILIGFLRLPTTTGITILAWLHVWWASFGVFQCARLLKANVLGAMVGGICFGLSAFMMRWVGLASVPTTVAWIPWVVACGLAIRAHGVLRNALLSGGCIAMLLLAGHLQFAAIGLIAWFAVSGTLIFREFFVDKAAAMRCIFGCTIALGIGALVSYPQLGPVLAAGKTSHRQNTPTQEGFAAYQRLALSSPELPGLFLPSVLGNPKDPIQIENGPVVGGFWPALSKAGGNFAESSFGWGPIVLGCIAMLRFRRQDWGEYSPVLVIALIGLIFAIGHTALASLYYLVPGWSATGSPGRGGVLWLLAGCILAALSIRWGTEERSLTRQQVVARAFTVLAVMVAVVVWAWFAMPPFSPGAVVDSLGWIAAGTLGVSYLLLTRAGGRLIFPVAAVLLLGMNMRYVSYGQVPTLRVSPKPTGLIAIINERWNLMTLPKALMPPNLAALYRIREVGGYDSIISREKVDELKQMMAQDPAPPENGNMMFIKPTVSPEKLKNAGVTEVWSANPLPWPGLEEIGSATENGFYRYDIARYSPRK